MAPITSASTDATHQPLMDSLDIQRLAKPFRKPTWKPAVRRNKNVKQIISEASRREASLLPTPAGGSGAVTPREGGTGDATPEVVGKGGGESVDLRRATQSLSHLVVERNAAAAAAAAQSQSQQNGGGPVAAAAPFAGPSVTYSNIESAPSFHPSSQRHYCDITGLPAPYTDPKSRLRYHNGEMFAVVRGLGQHPTESYLAARGAHTVLK